MPTLQDARSLTITFLTPVSLGSLNGSDKEADNVSSIKKLTRGSKTFPYVSSQAVRRALRDQLGTLNHELSEGAAAKEKKGAAITACLPERFIDDDLFGFMDASKGGTHKRTSPVRVAPLLAIDPYEGDLDFGTNYMGVDAGGTPNIFETEIHGGLYRGTILIELDAVGKNRPGEGVSAKEPRKDWDLKSAEKARRVNSLLGALQHLWSSGRQSRFLADISPKFIAAAVTTAKVPLFLESVRRSAEREVEAIDADALMQSVNDAKDILVKHCFGARAGLFGNLPEGTVAVGEAFDTVRGWVNGHFGVKGAS
jgi:CRISPR-associated protein Cst2